MTEKELLFQATGISKSFGAIQALKNVDLSVYRGEVRGLIGENGSGKSTLTAIAAGMLQPTTGKMKFQGKEYKPETVIDGTRTGIGMVVQEQGTVSGITIAENIFLGREDLFRKHGLISKKMMLKEARKALEKIGLPDIDPASYIDSLDMESRKLVEIAKTMYDDPEIVVIDETTTALSQYGREIVYKLMKEMREKRKAVLFISHDLEETMEHCDSLTVLRDGNLVATLEKKDFEENLVKKYMVGREISNHYYREDNECTYSPEVVIRAEQITTGRGLLENVSFELHKGEILGIGGLSHCGMHELGRAVFGEEPLVTGKIIHVPSQTEITDARTAIHNGIGYVSKNRDQEALVLTADVKENIAGAGMDLLSKGGVISSTRENAYVDRQIENLRIKCSSRNQIVKNLSGGNKQKVVFGKWMGRGSKILILDCPTRGVDIGVKALMYKMMEEMKQKGCSILLISEEMMELIGMCDRLLVLKNGQVSGEMHRGKDMTENIIIESMI